MTREQQQGEQRTAQKGGLFWMLLPVGLLVTSVSGWLVMVSLAVDDPGFAVEPDYYKKAAHYDAEIEQQAENNRLGYRVEVISFAPSRDKTAALVLSVMGPGGEALSAAKVVVEAIPVARAFDAQSLAMSARGPGVFEAKLERSRTGLYELRVRIEHEGRVFTRVLRPELAAASTPSIQRAERTPPV